MPGGAGLVRVRVVDELPCVPVVPVQEPCACLYACVCVARAKKEQ